MKNIDTSESKCVSITQLAAETGVSVGTVSRALNNRGRISPETRQKVLAAARGKNFKPRMSARRQTVALVTDQMGQATTGGYVTCLLKEFIEQLADHDVAVELYTERNVARLHERFVDGVLTMAWSDDTIKRLNKLKDVPVVFMNRFDLKQFSVVGTDQRQSARLAVNYLAACGHQRIGIVMDEARIWGFEQRLAGYRDVHRERNLPIDDSLVTMTRHVPIYTALKGLMEKKPTAVFLANGDINLEASHVLSHLLGLKIGKDISVVTIENDNVTRFLDPPETAIRQPLDRMAAKAVEILMHQIQTNDLKPVHAVLENELIERESVVKI